MQWVRGLAITLGTWMLWVVAAWGQTGGEEFEGTRARLQAGMEISFFTYSPPELSLNAQVQRKDWQMGIQLVHPLDPESSSPSLTLTERVQIGAGFLQLTLSNGESGAGLDALVQGKTPYGQGSVHLQIFSPGASATLNGSLVWDTLTAKIEQLRYAAGSLQVKKKVTLKWTPSPELSIALSVDEKSGFSPLEVKFHRELEKQLKLELTGRFTIGDQRLEPLGWEASLSREKDVGAGLRLDARGAWQQIWLEGTRPWGPVSLTGTLYIAPAGWEKLRFQGALEGRDLPERFAGRGKLTTELGPEGFRELGFEGQLDQWPSQDMTSKLGGTLDLKSDGWSLTLKPYLTFGLGSILEGEIQMGSTRWGGHVKAQLIEIVGSAQGEFKWEPKGLSDLQLNASLLLDNIALQGNFICSGICDGQTWTATVMGNLALEVWELSGQLGLAPSGWESVSVGVTRLFSF